MRGGKMLDRIIDHILVWHDKNGVSTTGYELNNLRLNYSLYFIQANNYYKYGQPLIEEDFECWAYGPIIPEVYWKFRIFGGNEIHFTESYMDTKELIHGPMGDDISAVLEMLMSFDNHYLNNVVRNQSPWLLGKREDIIHKESIKEYFTKEVYERSINF